jgi:hypothetical protein
LTALEAALARSDDAPMRGKKKQRLIVDVDSTEDPAHGKQENAAFTVISGRTPFTRSSPSPICIRVRANRILIDGGAFGEVRSETA